MMSQEILHRENDKRGMFYIKKDNRVASELTYTLNSDDIMVVDHTETKREYEGQGLGSQLVERVVSYAREQSYKIEPLCPFVEVKFDETSAYSDVRA